MMGKTVKMDNKTTISDRPSVYNYHEKVRQEVYRMRAWYACFCRLFSAHHLTDDQCGWRLALWAVLVGYAYHIKG